MKQHKKITSLILAAISASSALALFGCGNDNKYINTSYDSDGVHYEIEYKFELTYDRVPISKINESIAHIGKGQASMTTSSDYRDYTIKASPDYAKRVGKSWKQLSKEYGLSRIHVIHVDSLSHTIYLDENAPAGRYRSEMLVPGLRYVKHTYEYIGDSSIGDTTEIIGEFAPLSNRGVATVGVGYDIDSYPEEPTVIWYDKPYLEGIERSILRITRLPYEKQSSPIFPPL